MNQYYLISQLPALEPDDGKSPLPISKEAFHEICAQFLNKKEMKVLDSLSLVPAREKETSGSEFVDAWNREERQLRLALAAVRAAKMKKTFQSENETFPASLMQTATTAVELGDPLAAEQYLNRCRLETLDRIRPMDSFSAEAVYCYALRLMLLARMRQFDAERGRRSYQNIYRSIIDGDNQEN